MKALEEELKTRRKLNLTSGDEALPRLKLKVEYAIIGYLIGELTDVEFKARIQSILDEFEGKALLHRNIGQLVLKWEKQNRALQHKFIEIWGLLEQISPQIKEGSKSS